LILNSINLESLPEELLPGLADTDYQEDRPLCLLHMRKASVDAKAVIVRKEVLKPSLSPLWYWM
jgi:hypothetical protein